MLKKKLFYWKNFSNVQIRNVTKHFRNYVAIFKFIMWFSTEDKVILKHYRFGKHYGVKGLLKEFLNKGWTKRGLRHLPRKIDKTGVLRGFLVVAEPRRLSLMKIFRKLKTIFLVQKKI